jgi:hypothetical protein
MRIPLAGGDEMFGLKPKLPEPGIRRSPTHLLRGELRTICTCSILESET